MRVEGMHPVGSIIMGSRLRSLSLSMGDSLQLEKETGLLYGRKRVPDNTRE